MPQTRASSAAGHGFTAVHWVTGMSGAPAEKGADRLGPGNGDPGEAAAQLPAMPGRCSLPLHRHDIGDEPARRAGSAAQQRSTKPGVAIPPPMKTASGECQVRQRLRCLPGDDLDLRRAQYARILGDERRGAWHRSRRQSPSCPGRQRSHSIAMDPQPAPTSQSRCPGKGAERGQRRRADLALGELSVMAKGVIRQPRQTGKTGDARIGNTFDRQGVEIGCPRQCPFLGCRFENSLLRGRPYARGRIRRLCTVASPRELRRDLRRRRAVMG